MSKCDIRITFDKSDRTYRGGEKVTGEVHVQVNKDIRCNGILLTHYWRTHGRGNTDQGEKHQIKLADMAPLQAGEELHFPFEFTAELWPLTYHGNYIYLDHYVHVAVDLPWAIDPKHEEEYVLLPGRRPPEFTGARGEIVEIEGKKSGELSGLPKLLLYGFLAIIMIMLSLAFVMIVPFLLIGGGGFWIWKKMIASRVGEVDLKIPHVVVGPGENVPLELNFTAKKTFPINGITIRIECKEAATSGSGTNKTTHTNVVHEDVQTLRPAGSLTQGEEVHENVLISIPDSDAWSLDKGSNDITWSIEARIDIPRFPDWSKTTNIQLVPLEFLDDAGPATSPPAVSGPDKSSFATPIPPPTYAEVGETWDESADGTAEDSYAGEDMGPLLALLDRIEEAGRFSNERTEIAEAAEGHTYDVAIIVDRVSTTFGFSGDDERFETGRTVLGRLVGTDHEVQLFTVRDNNAALDDTGRGEQWQTLCTVKNWDTLYDRLVLLEVPFE